MSYTATGGVSVFGTAKVVVDYFYFTKFAIGAIAYSKSAAKNSGKLEPIIIKNYKLLFDPKDVLYKDTLNALWNERHLCTKSEAVALAIIYYQRLSSEAESYFGLN